MAALASNPENEVVHLSQQSALNGIAGVKKLQYKVPSALAPVLHLFLMKIHEALIRGNAIKNALLQLRQQGSRPDIIVSYTGYGQNFYLKDIYPDVSFIGYFEWYLNAFGAEYNFDPAYPFDFDRQFFLHINNAKMLIYLQSSDGGITPTRWQQSQFPLECRNKLHVIHDGGDAEYYSPKQPEYLELNGHGLALNGS